MDLFLSILLALLIFPRIFPQPPIEEQITDLQDTKEPEVISKAVVNNKIETFVESSASSPTTTPQESALSEYVYPGASTISSSSTSLTLKSSDSSQKITDWYKEKIKSKEMNATSFVSTSANGYVLNKLEGAGEGGKISVEIKKEEVSSEVTITVNFSS